MPIRNQNRKVARAVGNRTNFYSDDIDKRGTTNLQEVVEKIADKVDSSIGDVAVETQTGADGTMRFIKDRSSWYLEFKTEDGWVRSSNASDSGFILRDKSS
jgi:hypothetical protein